MVILLSLFLLFYQANDLQTAKMSPVVFSAVKQGLIKDPACIPLFSRQITFKIKNRSDKAIYVHGLKTDNRYYPLGYLLRHIAENDRWGDQEGNTPQLAYKRKEGDVDVYVLPPGKSMKFYDLAEQVYVGSTVKRSIYISYSLNENPEVLMSDEFILR